jgi:O-antigen ligase
MKEVTTLEFSNNELQDKGLSLEDILLIFCFVWFFVAKFCPVINLGIKGISELNLVIYIFLFLSTLQMVLKREKPCFHSPDLAIIFIMVYCFISVVVYCYLDGLSYTGELVSLKHYLNPFIVYFLLKNAISNLKQIRVLLNCLIVALVFTCVLSFVAYAFSLGSFIHFSGRAQAFFDNPNGLAVFIATLFPLLLAFFRPKNLFGLWFKALSVFIVLITLIQTGSRGSFIAMCAATGFLFIKAENKFRNAIIGVFSGILILTIMQFASSGGENVFNRFQKSAESVNTDGSVDWGNYSSGRLAVWEGSLKVYLNRPIWGYGFMSFSRNYAEKYVGVSFVAHNRYLDYLFTLGIIGFSLFIFIYYKIWKILTAHDDLIIANACRLGLLAYWICIFFTNGYALEYVFWPMAAIGLRFVDLHERNMDLIHPRA